MSEMAAAAPTIDEALYQQSLERLKAPRPIGITSVVFTILLLVFVASVFVDLRSIEGVVLLVAAVVIHEAGHAVGMRCVPA